MIARYGRASVVLLGLLVAVVTWNALRYPPGLGYDANDHFQYLLSLAERREIPDGIGEYYTPPLFYAVAAAGWKIGTWLGLGEPLRVVQLLNAVFVVGSALLVLELARAILPGRRRAHTLALGFVVAGAVAVKAGAMVHPEALSLLLCAAALTLTARVIVDRAFGLAPAVAIGVLLGLAQLVRAFALWTVAVVLLTLVGVAIGLREHRRQVLGTLAGTAVVAVLVASPWYAYQSSRYTNPIFDRPQVSKPLWERRPAAFYLDLGLPELITRPYRPSFRNRLELAGSRSRASEVIELMMENPIISSYTIQKRLQVTNQGARNLILQLERRGLVERLGKFGRGGRNLWVSPEVFTVLNRPQAQTAPAQAPLP